MATGGRAARLRKRIGASIDQVRADAEAIGRGVDRAGEWSMRMGKVAIRNPGRTAVIATALLFAIVRIPTESFYAELGLRPEDVGLDSFEVLLQGSAILLFFFTLVSAALAALALLIAIVLMVPHAILVGRLPRRGPRRTIWQSISRTVRRVCRLAPVVIPVVSIGLVTYYFFSFTKEDLEVVKSGKPLEEILAPWRAEPVELIWSGGGRLARMPTSCHWLLYLGEDDGRVVIYDAMHDDTYRINSKKVELEFPIFCAAPPRRG